jgi:hypothetical protein
MGLMSSKEFLLSQVPDVSWYVVWGCKASVLEPRTEGRKDFHGKTVTGFMAGFSDDDNPIAYKVYIPELSGVVYLTNVVFDQNIPPPSEGYHLELRAVVVQEGPRMHLADVEAKILNKTYEDEKDGLLYDVKGVRMLRDKTLVADVALHGSAKKIRTPIYVADIIRMVKAMDTVAPSTEHLHRAIQERDDGTHKAALYLESLSHPHHPSCVMTLPADVIPAALENCKRPYGKLSLAFRCNEQECYCMYDVSCASTRHGRSPYGESSQVFHDIEQDCSHMSDTERKKPRQCLEHDSAYFHLNEGVVKTCLERCSTLNCTERSSVRKCLLAQKALCGEEYTPSVAVSLDSGAANTECLLVKDPTDAWVQQEETRGADRLPPSAHPNIIESTSDPEHTLQVVGMLNRGLNKLAERWGPTPRISEGYDMSGNAQDAP